METFSALLAICAGNSSVPVNSPQKGQWRGALMFSLICVWINGRVNNREAGDLRRYRAHYDVLVMWEKNPSVAVGLASQRASNAGVSMSWCDHESFITHITVGSGQSIISIDSPAVLKFWDNLRKKNAIIDFQLYGLNAIYLSKFWNSTLPPFTIFPLWK